MAKIHELIDSLTNDNAAEMIEQIKSEASALEVQNKQLYSRAKKAEGFEYDKSSKQWVRSKKVSPQEPPQPSSNKPNNDFDYGELSYLAVKGYEHEDDLNYIKTIKEKSGEPLRKIIEDDYVVEHLRTMKEERMVQNAIPSSQRRAPAILKNTVDYWLAKGELPPMDQVQLRRDVLNERINRERQKSKFTDNPVITH